jgi:RNA polymerase sigma-70 factor (sigma-E family)
MSGVRREDDDRESFRVWAEARVPVLRRRAYLLCGSWHTADDLVQDTLIKVYLRWGRVAEGPNPDAYATRVLMTRHLDDRRRPWRRERSSAEVPETGDTTAARALGGVESQDAVLTAALRHVPLPQRAVLVLRFAEDLSVEQVAEILGISAGTVRSRCSRGAERMRTELARLGHLAVPTGSSEAERAE